MISPIKTLRRWQRRAALWVGKTTLKMMQINTLRQLSLHGEHGPRARKYVLDTLKGFDLMWPFASGRDEFEQRIWDDYPSFRELIQERRRRRDADQEEFLKSWENLDVFGPGTLRPPENGLSEVESEIDLDVIEMSRSGPQ